VGEPAESFRIIQKDAAPNISIPDMDPAGIETPIYVSEQALLKDISVSVKIEHTYIGDLRVSLTSPSGETVILHDRAGRSSHDIVKTYDLSTTPQLMTYMGDQIRGDWVLHIADHARFDTGHLAHWGLKLSAQDAEKKTLTEELFPEVQIPDDDPKGIESLIHVAESGKLVNLDLSVAITHTWIGDLKVILVLPSGDEVTLHNKTGYSRKNIEKTYSTKSDEFLQFVVGIEVKGDWRLKVIDLASRDIGTLSKWGMDLIYE